MSVSARILFVTVKVKTEVKFALDTWIFYQNLILPQLRSDSHSPQPPPAPPPKKIICFNDSHSKMMKNAFLFHLNSSFRSQDI